MSNEQLIIKATEGREHFSTQLPGHQVAWDSTSLGDFKSCARKYFYSQVMGLRSKYEAIPLTFGIHFHAAIELYLKLKFAKQTHDEAILEVVRYLTVVLRVLTDPDDPESPGKFWAPDDKNRNSFTLIRALVWYLDQFKDDAIQTLAKADGTPMVELSFRMTLDSLPAPRGIPYLICGHMDQVGRFGDAGIYVVDHKTTTMGLDQKYFDQYSPDNQMTLYTLAAKVVFQVPAQGVIVDGCQLGTGFARFNRGMVHRSNMQLNEWVEDLKHWLALSQHYAEQQYWPHNDKFCSMYGGCTFRKVCSKDASVRPAIIAQEFIHSPWNPLESR